MQILLALPHRDLLTSLTKVLTLDGHRVIPVFDGVQALSRAAAEKPEAAVLDGRLPRVPLWDLVAKLRESDIPVLLLLDSPVTAKTLMENKGAASFLPYPFSPDDLSRRLTAIVENAASGQVFQAGDASVDASRFLLNGKVFVTLEEIDFLKAVSRGDPPAYAILYMAALREKFRLLGLDQKIQCVPGAGYRLVTHE